MPVRKGAHTIDGTTDGLAVFLYDAGRLEELRREGTAAFVDAQAGGDPEAGERKRLEEIARRGLLVEYELQGDGPVQLEVAVGPPLGAAEKKGARWLRDQTAILSLPTGALCVDWGDVEEEFGDAPSRLDVPPGDYLATLHRRDPEGAAADGADVLTLSRAGEQVPPAEPWPLLSFGEAAGWPKPPAAGTVDGNVFRGTFVSAPGRAFTNAYRREIQELGLRFGAHLAVALEGRTLRAVHIGRLRLPDVERVLGPGGLDRLPAPAPELYATVELDSTLRRECLYLTSRPSVAPPFPSMKPDDARVPFTLTVLPDPYVHATDPGLVMRRSVEGGEIRTVVLARHDGAVILGVGAEELAKLKVKDRDVLVLRFPSGERTAYYAVDARRTEQLAEFVFPVGAADRERLEALAQKRAELQLALIKAASAEDRARLRDELARLGDEVAAVRLPPDRLRAAPLEASLWRHWERKDTGVLMCRPLVGERTYVDHAVGAPVTIVKPGPAKKAAAKGSPKASPRQRKR